MSLFRTVETPCPTCAAPVKFELVHSVNADRRPDLRDAILARTFQQETCAACGEAFRMEPELTYVHAGGKQWYSAWPSDKVDLWTRHERHGKEAFERAYGPSTPAAVIGRELRPRVVFGWEAFREKIVAFDAGIDDITLELAKIALLRTLEGLSLEDERDLRLVGIDGDTLVIGVFELGTEEPVDALNVPKALLAEIEAAPDAWKALRDQVGEGMFVDVARLLAPTLAPDRPAVTPPA